MQIVILHYKFMRMNDVICLQQPALRYLVDELLRYVDEKYSLPKEQWVNSETAMSLLNIRSRTTLAEIRDSGAIRYSNPSSKNILYDRASIEAYIEKHAHRTF